MSKTDPYIKLYTSMEVDAPNTRTKKRKFIREFQKQDQHLANSCRATGISRQTYYDWLAKDKSFSEVIEEIIEGDKDDLEAVLRQVGRGEYFMVYDEDGKQVVRAFKTKPDTTMLIWLSKTKLKDRGYIEKTEQVQFDGNIKVKTEAGLPENPEDQEVPQEILSKYKNEKK